MLETKVRFGIKVEKIGRGCWSIGACFTYDDIEKYLFINAFKWTILIGKVMFYEEKEI